MRRAVQYRAATNLRAAAPATNYREFSAICAITDTGLSVWRTGAAFRDGGRGRGSLNCARGRGSLGARLVGLADSLEVADYGNRGLWDATHLTEGG
jgi:hypothetical protein